MNRCTFFLILILGSPVAPPASGAPPDLLDGRDYTVEVTAAARHPEGRFPRDPIPDDLYKPTDGEIKFTLRFSEKGRHVTILPDGVSGTLEKSDAHSRVFTLDKGLFAGGELVVKKDKAGWVATFTEFGSGVPVIASLRGTVTPPK